MDVHVHCDMCMRMCHAVQNTMSITHPTLFNPCRLRKRSLVLYVRGCQLADGSGSVPPGTEVRGSHSNRQSNFGLLSLNPNPEPNSNTANSDVLNLGLDLRL